MLASSFMDPMLGLDIHWEMVPMPAPVPTPIPNPFTGIVFDPIGLAAGLALSNLIGAVMGASFKGPVLYWGFPATNTGTEGKHVPGHILIPPGTAWAPVPRTPKPVIRPNETPKPPKPITPDDDAIVVFGSKTVTVLGSNAVRMGDIALSCSEPVRLPSSVVLAVPKGRPIMVGGPMSLDIMAAVLASLRTRFIGDSLQALLSRLSPGRFRSFLQWAACKLTGHPVDVASGKMMTRALEVELPGPMPLKIERFYSSAFASRRSPLGCGWSISLDQAVWEERGQVVLLDGEGREVVFDSFGFPNHRVPVGEGVYHPLDRLTLKRRSHTEWTVTSDDGVRRDFGPVAGQNGGRARIKQIVSRCDQQRIVFEYIRGVLAAVVDSAGRRITLDYDEHGQIVSLNLPTSNGAGSYIHRKYAYGTEGDLLRVTDPEGHAWSYEYQTHLLVRETNRNGLNFYFEYDGLGADAWCIRTWGDGGIYDHLINYDKRNHVTYVTNSLGHTTQYHMNIAGLVTKVIDPLGGTTLYEYDNALRNISIVDPLGNKTESTFDERGNRILFSAPDKAVVQVDFSRENNPTRFVDPAGGVWIQEWDECGLLERQIEPTGAVRLYEYTDFGQLTRATDPRGYPTTIEYDTHGNLFRFTDALNRSKKFSYDELGNLLSMTNALALTYLYRYDLKGRVVEAISPGGATIECQYDAEDNLTLYKDENGGVTTLAYCGIADLKRVTRPDGSQVEFHYNTEQQVIGLTNERGQSYSVLRDPVNRITEEIDYWSQHWRYTYNPGGHVQTVTDPLDRIIELKTDPVGRILERTSQEDKEIFVYDALGRISKCFNSATTVERSFDPLGRVVEERQGSTFKINYVYDLSGNRVERVARLDDSRRQIEHRVRYGYNADDEVVEVQIDNRPPVNITRDLLGRIVSETFTESVRREFAYLPDGFKSKQEAYLGATQLFEISYYYDRSGNLVERRDSAFGLDRFSYDLLDRITEHLDPRNRLRRFLTDPIGHLIRTITTDDGETVSANDAWRRAGDVNGSHYVFDRAGQLVEKTNPTRRIVFHWNSYGRLTQSITNGIDTIYHYDPLGRRICKSTSGRNTYFYWDGHLICLERKIRTAGVTNEKPIPPPEPFAKTVDLERYSGTDPPQLTRVYVHYPSSFEPLLLLQQIERETPLLYHYHNDPNGCPTRLTNESGEVVWEAHYTLWGAIDYRTTTAIENPLRLQGQYADEETGLRYNRYRYFDPELGGFISQDPLGIAPDEDLYSFGPNSYGWVDPLGLAPGDPSGVYTIIFSDGTKYHGKGLPSRMAESVRRELAAAVAIDPNITVVSATPTAAVNSREAFKEEARRIAADGGVEKDVLRNRINSPGKKYLDEDAKAAKKTCP
jgi:RHS repeat-associated protein